MCLVFPRKTPLSKTVTVSLCGGLGNQLFQYATARAVAIRCDAALTLDLSWFDEAFSTSSVTPRKYALAPFSLPVRLGRVRPVSRVRRGHLSRFLTSLGHRLEPRFNDNRFLETSFGFDEQVLRLEAPAWLAGYWQSPRYFCDVAPQIRADIGTYRGMTDACLDLLQKIRSVDAVCIHVRRGDYVTNKEAASFHGLCSLGYYTEGVSRVVQDLKVPHAFVFSDDPEWVQNNLDLCIDFTVVDINGVDDPHLDLWLMSACSHFVIANSSLSWWGAWLSTSIGKRVVAPARWFSDPAIDTSDLIPHGWIRI